MAAVSERYGCNGHGNPREIACLQTSRMSRAQISPLLLSVSLSFAGCASYSGIQGEAQALAPQSLAFHQDQTGGDWPREDWWSRFGDPKLDALLPLALQGNTWLRAPEARVGAARAL